MKKLIGIVSTVAFLIMVFLYTNGHCATQNIYIDDNAPTGDGSIGDPYNALSDINWSTGEANSIFDWVAADDDVIINLARGDEWREQLTVGTSGVSGHPITIQAYGTGADPIITGADLVSTWTSIPDYFCSDFEEDSEGSSPSEWTTVTETVGTVQAVAAGTKNGSFGMRCSPSGDTVTLTATEDYGSPVTEFYGGAWVRFNFAASENTYGVLIRFYDGATYNAGMNWVYNSGTTMTQLDVKVVDDVGTEHSVGSIANCAENVWYWIQWSYASGDGDGVFSVTANSTTVTKDDLDNDATRNEVDTIQVGITMGAYLTGGTVDFDDVSVHTAVMTTDLWPQWEATLATETKVVIFDGTVGVNQANVAALDVAEEWYHDHANNLLYCNAVSDPDSLYSLVEAGQRVSAIDTSDEDYLTFSGITAEGNNATTGSGFYVDGTNIIIDDCTAQNNYYFAVRFTAGGAGTLQDSTVQYNMVGGVLLNSTAGVVVIDDNIITHNGLVASTEGGTINHTGISADSTAGLTISNNDISYSGENGDTGHSHGIYLVPPGNNATIENNTIYESYSGHGIACSWPDVTIRHNRVYNCDDNSAYTGILLSRCYKATAGTVDVYYNLSYNNQRGFEVYKWDVDSGNTDGIGATANVLIDSGQNFESTVTVSCVVENTTDNTYSYVTVVDSNTQLTLNDDIMDDGEDYLIHAWGGNTTVNLYNNTFYSNTIMEFSTKTNVLAGLNIKNNIFFHTDASRVIYYEANQAALDQDYNDIYSTGGGNFSEYEWENGSWANDTSFANWQAATEGSLDGTQDANSVSADPLFVDAADGNFRLKFGSPCINTGADLGASYDDAFDPRDTTWPYDTLDQDDYGAWDSGGFLYRRRFLVDVEPPNPPQNLEVLWKNL